MSFDHMKAFREFCHYEMLTGGPDPHMRVVVDLAKDLPREEKIWRAALYVGFYNVPSAEAAWRAIPVFDAERTVTWLRQNWDGVRFRRERKSVGLDATRGDRFAEYLYGAQRTLDSLALYEDAPFESLWCFATGLPHVGRYAATKLVEIWRRLGLVRAELQDIRAKGGWSPREALNLIYDLTLDARDDRREAVVEAEERAWLLNGTMGLSYFDLEVLLCEYKTSYSTMRQYPGRSLDSELHYEEMVGDSNHEHMSARSRLFPAWSLGERMGWEPQERLKHLGRVLRDHGYTWSDSIYDYQETKATGDFSSPRPRIYA